MVLHELTNRINGLAALGHFLHRSPGVVCLELEGALVGVGAASTPVLGREHGEVATLTIFLLIEMVGLARDFGEIAGCMVKSSITLGHCQNIMCLDSVLQDSITALAGIIYLYLHMVST